VAAAAEAAPGVTIARVPYAGVATRAVALAIDAAIANLIVLAGAGFLSLITSLVGGDLEPQWLAAGLAACGWALVVGGYFVTFWAVTGQTPGMRMMRLRVVVARDGEPPSLLRAIVRLIGLGLAIIPLFAGFLPVLFDDRRRALQDFMAGTVVLYADADEISLGGAGLVGG
jgi:uncharacterized RDD family membrane protein YckC